MMQVLAGLLFSAAALGQVLPEDRFDVLYHSYEGDNVEITGPSILVRKQLTSTFSGYANYYVDSISSASIDVLSYASPYSEKRNEISVGGDYLLADTVLSAGVTNSDEPDFKAQTAFFGVSQDMFGGLTTIRMGFARGWDEVGNVADPDFKEDVDRRSYRLGLTQVMTKNFIMDFNFEAITDEGYLNNPYRQVRYRDFTVPEGYLWQTEVYPNTRTSSAFSVGGRYFLRPGSAIYGEARFYDDTWGITGWNASVGYSYPFLNDWVADIGYRLYTQSAADFYSDLFDFASQQNFIARDKELSTFTNQSIRLAIRYDMPVEWWDFLERGTVNLHYDYMRFDYDDFRNVLAGGEVGSEPLFNFAADVVQLYVSFWF